jgi:hemerythrin-like domain-containing protein
MAVNIGGPPEHNFDQPLGLLSDCHRRIERFLGILTRIAEEARGGMLGEDQRRALAIAMRYFREAAPRHTADEEESLFPRMRACGDSEVGAALERLAALEADHRHAGELHAESNAIFSQWQDAGGLPDEKAARLREALSELTQIYTGHIRVEDQFVFPLAGRTLDRETQLAIGREMAKRRGIGPA